MAKPDFNLSSAPKRVVNRPVEPSGLLSALNEVEKKYAPKILYISGDPQLFQHGFRVAIVGSRKATTEGLQRSRRLAQMISERDGLL